MILCTTSLSVGVDPKRIKFTNVFMWTHANGCNILQMFQALMRFGRQEDFPLDFTTLHILMSTMPPGVRLALQASGKKKPVPRPTFNDILDALYKRRYTPPRAPTCAASGDQWRPTGLQAAR